MMMVCIRTLRISIGRAVHQTLMLVGVDTARASNNGRASSIRSVMRESRMLLNGFEASQLFEVAKAVCSKLDGDLAEVGVYRGGSAKLLGMAKRPGQALYLFDTFEGLPEPENRDDKIFCHKQFSASLEGVASYLSTIPNVHIYKGLFPQTAEPISSKRFCFVHIDVDLYRSVIACLECFYPRVVGGGVILCHDYDCDGPHRAVDEFFSDKVETVFPLPAGQYCIIVKALTDKARIDDRVCVESIGQKADA